jgi:uncharacterized protein (TIGR02598 family)
MTLETNNLLARGPASHGYRCLSAERGKSGFSLVEVALSIAIAAFGMPVSFDNVKSAGNTVTSSRIFQQMLGELESMDWGVYGQGFPGWTKLDNLQAGKPSSRRFFDVEGTRLAEDDEDEMKQKLVYVAEFFFPPLPVQMTGASVAASAATTRPDTRRVVIRLMESPDPAYVFKEGGVHQERAFTVARPF